MSEFKFRVSKRLISRDTATRRHRIAQKHGCTFTEMKTPWGYSNWFSAPNRGKRQNQKIRFEVNAELALFEKRRGLL